MTEEMKNVTPETAEAPEHVETMEDYKEELEASSAPASSSSAN